MLPASMGQDYGYGTYTLSRWIGCSKPGMFMFSWWINISWSEFKFSFLFTIWYIFKMKYLHVFSKSILSMEFFFTQITFKTRIRIFERFLMEKPTVLTKRKIIIKFAVLKTCWMYTSVLIASLLGNEMKKKNLQILFTVLDTAGMNLRP